MLTWRVTGSLSLTINCPPLIAALRAFATVLRSFSGFILVVSPETSIPTWRLALALDKACDLCNHLKKEIGSFKLDLFLIFTCLLFKYAHVFSAWNKHSQAFRWHTHYWMLLIRHKTLSSPVISKTAIWCQAYQNKGLCFHKYDVTNDCVIYIVQVLTKTVLRWITFF